MFSSLSLYDHLFFFVLLLGKLKLLEFHVLEWPHLGTAAGMTHTERVYLYVQANLLDGDSLSSHRGLLGGAYISNSVGVVSCFCEPPFAIRRCWGAGCIVGGEGAHPGE